MRYVDVSPELRAKVDDEDYERVAAHAWFASRSTVDVIYAQRHVPGERLAISMHRFVLGLGAADGRSVDHRDSDGLNNQKSNLRLANPSQQGANRRKVSVRSGRAASSKYKGVIHAARAAGRPWQAAIRRDGRRQFIGNFATEEQAAIAYNHAALQAWGEFALLNNIADS